MRLARFVLLLLCVFMPAMPADAQESICWTDVVNVAVEADGDLVKTSSCAGCRDARARSEQVIASGDGYLEFTLEDNVAERAIGLSNGSLATHEDQLAFSWLIEEGVAYVREHGVYRTDTPTVVGSVLKIVVDGGQVYYYKGTQLIYASTVAPTYPLAVHVLLLDLAASVTNAVLDTSEVMAAAAATSSDEPMPPLITGPYHYHNYRPGTNQLVNGIRVPTENTTTFIRPGQTFVDPVHNSTIRRLTNEFPGPSESDIYGKNGFWNKDSTRMFHRSPNGNQIVNTSTGAIVRSNVPGNFDGSFAPDHGDTWYYFSGTTLRKMLVSTGATSLVKNFGTGATLGPLGGSIDWISRSGRYMVLNIAGQLRVWDKDGDNGNGLLYAGSLPADFGGGFAGITPDAKYLVRTKTWCMNANDEPVECPPDGSLPARTFLYSHLITHTAGQQRVDPNGVMFWSLCGGHGDLVSTSADPAANPPIAAKNYWVTFECHDGRAIYRVDITLPQQHSETNVALRDKQRNDNRKIFDLPGGDDGHIAGGGRGLYQNWVYLSIESPDDPFGAYDPNWPALWNRGYKQELVMVNVRNEPFEIRRLAHHRSRNPTDNNYYYQPRVSASWDGTRIAWASNFNYRHPDSAIEYADIYSIRHKLTATFTAPSAGATVRGTQPVTMSLSGSMSESWNYELRVDGTLRSTELLIPASQTTATYSWPTTSVANGSHTLTLKVWDKDGLAATTTRTVTVNNP